ncbi:hypothetical protein ACS0PU_009343 [Formica fusca]
MSTLGISCYEDGFRLGGPPSECSLRSKAQIDALFEDSRSICSSTLSGWYAGLSVVIPTNPDDSSAEEQKRVNSAVQARIEAMFASVEAESGTPGECAAAILPVKYMGAAPVGGRVASVRGLQEPLRQLLERIEGCVRAELEISRRGLTFRTSDVCEKNNPFRRIAVWSALKLRCKRIPSGDVHHAFLPLVGDQDQRHTQTLENKHADLYRTMRGLKNETELYPPIFAVVMRRPGAARLLECHGFACETEEDAVAAAATLYRALLADLDANRRRPRHTNGVGCISLASVASSVREPSLSSRINCLLPPPPRPTAPHPVRPPRTKKSSMSSSVTEDEGTKSSLQKMPRRKKKNSDVKAEDILEARGKRRDVKNEKSKFGQSNRDIILSRNEELQNSKNKTFSTKDQNSLRIEIESEKPDEIYNINDTNRIYERQSNKYEKLYKQNNPKKEPADLKDIYETNYGSYNLNRGNADNCERQSYSSRADSILMYDKVDKTGRNETNSKYKQTGGKKESTYSPRIEDDDKIYSLEKEEIYVSKNNNRNNKMKSSQEDIFFAKNLKNSERCQSRQERSDSTTKQQRRSRDPERMYSGKRLNRVVTMDKPLRKEQSDPVYSLSIPEYSRPRRRRSRAGSEPPVSHSENKLLQENALKRSQSDIDVDRGDLMTRVELPRRGSFLTSGSTRRSNNIKGGTPLGFTELFDEFRNQEGLTSVDDILAAIIDPEGMSFNDLKPLYKEFLLKLAATLTQDELYQRSASIMRRRRRPQRRRSNRRSCLLGKAIKRSVSRLKGGPTEFTSVIFPARRLNDSFGSSSSCDVRNNHRNRVLASRLGRRKSSWKATKNGACHTTSEDSDTCRRLNRNMGATANRSSSGYVSCSECSYDSESCTCVSADKCYCSLSRRIPATSVPGNTVVCACDTDSCSESNKCYCARKPIQSTILEQLRQKGIVPSESTLSRGDSPERIRSSRMTSSHSSSRNTDFLKTRSSPICGSSDNLALDYDLFSPGRKSQQSSGSEKVLVVSARDTQGRLVYVGGTERDKKYSSRGNGRPGAHHEALSIKKSAEIAAVFGAGENNRNSRRTSNASSIRSSISLEAGLGYLP